MVQVRLRACDGCGTVDQDSDVQKVTITMDGRRMTLDVCQNCRQPIDVLLKTHSSKRRTGRRSSIAGGDVLDDIDQIVKDNPRRKR
jgi:hypothetical protein